MVVANFVISSQYDVFESKMQEYDEKHYSLKAMCKIRTLQILISKVFSCKYKSSG